MGVGADVVAVLVDDAHGSRLHVGHDGGGDGESEKAESREAEVAEGDQARAVRAEGCEGGEDGQAGGGDAEGVEDEDGVEGDVERLEAVVDVFRPVDIGEADVERADVKLLLEDLVEVDVIYSIPSVSLSLRSAWEQSSHMAVRCVQDVTFLDASLAVALGL